MTILSPHAKSQMVCVLFTFLACLNSSLGQSLDKSVEFRGILGSAIGQQTYTTNSIRFLPMPNHFSSQYYLRTGLADSDCVSFQSKTEPEKYITSAAKLPLPEISTTITVPSITMAIPPDLDAATFCEKNGFLYSKKGTPTHSLVLSKWSFANSINAFYVDDFLCLSTIDYKNSKEPYEFFIPITYREISPVRFSDSYSISPVGGTFEFSEKGYLSEDENSAVIFRTHNFVTNAMDKPEHSEWFLHKVGDSYFSIQNASTGKYLVHQDERVSLVTYAMTQTQQRTESSSASYHTINDNALWKIEVVNAQGEYLIYNKASGNDTVLSLTKGAANNHNPVMVKIDLNAIESGMLHNITERFIHMKKLPEDITAQNSVVHLYNGIANRGLFSQSQFRENNWISLNHKIFIEDLYSDKKYHFISNVGSDPGAVTWSYDKTNNDNIALNDLVKSLPALKDVNADTKNRIVASVIQQLKSASHAIDTNSVALGEGYTPTILWLATEENLPDGVSETLIDPSGKVLRVVTNGIIDNNKVFGYGFLLKRTTKDGVVTYTIDDPDPVTNEER